MHFPSTHLMLLVLAVPIVVTGCGSGRPQTVAVTGTVTYKGDPVENAAVVFFKDKGAPPATGQTDASGVFTLTTFEPNDGAVPGEYVVTVAKVESAPEVEGDGRIPPPQSDKPPKSLIPVKYSEPNASDLKETVSAPGPNEITLELTD